MVKRFYPIILSAISESRVRMKIVKNSFDYYAFMQKFKEPGTEIKEIKTIESIYLERMSKFNPGIIGWSQSDRSKMDVDGSDFFDVPR